MPVRGIQRCLVGPADRVVTAVQQDRAAVVRAAVADDGAVAAVCLPPDFRVAKINGAAALGQILRGQHGVCFQLFVVHAVADGKALRLPVLQKALGRALAPNAGIHQQLAAVRQLQRAAGKAAGGIIWFIRRKRGGQTLPVQKILCF